MNEVRENVKRVGNITSSGCGAMMTNGKQELGLGKPAITYLEERNMERQMQLPLDVEKTAKPLSWGKCCEGRIFDIIGEEYELVSEDSITHHTIDYWAGTPDAKKHEMDGSLTVAEFKCPITRKSFMTCYNCNTIEEVREKHSDGEDYFQQIVSNAILVKAKFAELIVYMPYESELDAIVEAAKRMPEKKLYQYFWIANANYEELPYLKDLGPIQNIKVIRFEVKEADKVALTNRVKLCGNLLIERY